MGASPASALSFATFLLLDWPLSATLGNRGLWLAFVGYVIARALALLLYYPSLRKRIATK